MITVKMLPFIS